MYKYKYVNKSIQIQRRTVCNDIIWMILLPALHS